MLLFCALLLMGCDDLWNNPYPEDKPLESIYYTDFSERPKYLDPAKSYASAESRFIGQIYESPLQYNYLLRPYTLEPSLAAQMPTITYYNSKDELLPNTANINDIAYSIYEITIKPGVLYQPHPAFAQNNLSAQQLHRVHTLRDFPLTGTREVVAEDFVYQIKRLAQPSLNSPILDVMSEHIVGLADLTQRLNQDFNALPQAMRAVGYMDLRRYDFAGAKAIDRYTYQIKINGKYPQFSYWLAMMFFAPMPWEAELFYAQPELIKKNIVLDWYPVGTGPYLLAVNNPNRQMILEKNPNFRKEYYPSEGMPGDLEAGLLAKAGQQIPFMDKIVFNLEKESIPRWIKFLQGYYDQSSIGSDNFQQAIVVSNKGSQLAPLLSERGMKIYSTTSAMTFYWGFNMLDPILGGYDEKSKALRQAISIAMDMEEYISIFLNERGTAAQGPIPPGIEGYQEARAGMNPYVYTWQNDRAQRLSLDYAKQLLIKAGYPNGRDARTNEPLVLNYDVISTGDPSEKAEFAWVQKQFNKLNIELNIRATDYNRWREKMSIGYAQIFSFGWSADYPDPENFLFLLYGSNMRVGNEGVNSANYKNPAYDQLFEQLRYLDPGPEKQAVIEKMLAIIRDDAPWVFGFHPQIYTISQGWNSPMKLSEVANNTYKYHSLDPVAREKLRTAWNPPIIWPFFVGLLVVILVCLPVVIAYWRKEHQVRHKRI
jgi:ABC-type transport system substrate-binding protein